MNKLPNSLLILLIVVIPIMVGCSPNNPVNPYTGRDLKNPLEISGAALTLEIFPLV